LTTTDEKWGQIRPTVAVGPTQVVVLKPSSPGGQGGASADAQAEVSSAAQLEAAARRERLEADEAAEAALAAAARAQESVGSTHKDADAGGHERPRRGRLRDKQPKLSA
jgi:hypothetical protein